MKRDVQRLAGMPAATPSLAATPVLDPGELDAWASAAEADLLLQGENANTLRSYRAALRYWAAWHSLRYSRSIALPVSEATVVQFIVDHAQRLDRQGQLVHGLPPDLDEALVVNGFKSKLGAPALTTLIHRVAVLSAAHRLKEMSNPCDRPRVRELLRKTRRGYARRGDLANKKPALTREPLELLLATCDDSLIGKRDRALLLFAFSSGGRRRSEVVMATMENTVRHDEGYLFTLAVSKTNQAGDGRPENIKPLVGRAAQAMEDWLLASAIKTGPIFRRVRRGDRIGEPLSAAAVTSIVKKRCALAGVAEGFTAHSLRSGFVTEAGRQNIPLAETMALTGHRSVNSLVGYFRHAAARNPGARLMDDAISNAAKPNRGS